jgi:hypothetical protein
MTRGTAFRGTRPASHSLGVSQKLLSAGATDGHTATANLPAAASQSLRFAPQ